MRAFGYSTGVYCRVDNIKTTIEKANDENSKKEAKPIHKTSKDDYYIIPDKQNPDNNTLLLKDDFNQDGTPKKTEHE